jgi:regulatory protein
VLHRQKKLSVTELREKIFRYCSYQERCHSEVKQKLFELGASCDESDEIIIELLTQGFLNEERFAKAFAGGKFRLKSWGRIKITHALEQKGLTANCIKAGLSEIEEDAYVQTLLRLIEAKLAQVDEDDLFRRREKVANYLIQKGFEPELVWRILKGER